MLIRVKSTGTLKKVRPGFSSNTNQIFGNFLRVVWSWWPNCMLKWSREEVTSLNGVAVSWISSTATQRVTGHNQRLSLFCPDPQQSGPGREIQLKWISVLVAITVLHPSRQVLLSRSSLFKAKKSLFLSSVSQFSRYRISATASRDLLNAKISQQVFFMFAIEALSSVHNGEIQIFCGWKLKSCSCSKNNRRHCIVWYNVFTPTRKTLDF